MAMTKKEYGVGRIRGVKLSFTTATEAAPAAASDGVLLDTPFLSIQVEAASAMTTGGKLVAYLFNYFTQTWNPVSNGDLDQLVAAVQRQAFPGLNVVPGQRLCFVPSGVGQACDIYLGCV